MKTILTIFFIVAFSLGMAVPHSLATDFTSLDSRIRQLRGSIEVQIERMKSAREKSDTEMDLARIRLAEQLRRSEDDLYRQVAALERFHEQLANQVTEVKSAVSGYQKNWKSPMEQALAEIEAQVQNTNALMAQMEAARNNLDSRPQSGQSLDRSEAGRLRGATGCEPSASGSGYSLPSMQLSPQAQASPRTSREAPASKSKGASDISEPEIQVTTPDTWVTAPATNGTSTSQPVTPEISTGK
jgi:hypothetical protein